MVSVTSGKSSKQSCAIIIPVFNEEGAIRDTVMRLQRIATTLAEWQFEIICVNDASTDSTAAILNEIKGITVLTHTLNRGYGGALRTGLNHASAEWVFIVDADATYPIEELGQLLSEIDNGADMVVGARKGIGITASPFHRIARWILRKMTHILTGTMVPDLNSGMRVFRHRLYREFKTLLPLGFSFTTTLTMASLYSNYKIIYVPITYAPRLGKSNIKPVRDFFGFTMLIIRIASYFEPLRFFLPLAFGVMLIGFLKGSRDFIILGQIGPLAVIVFLMGVQIFLTGIIAEVIVRRASSSTETEILRTNQR